MSCNGILFRSTTRLQQCRLGEESTYCFISFLRRSFHHSSFFCLPRGNRRTLLLHIPRASEQHSRSSSQKQSSMVATLQHSRAVSSVATSASQCLHRNHNDYAAAAAMTASGGNSAARMTAVCRRHYNHGSVSSSSVDVKKWLGDLDNADKIQRLFEVRRVLVIIV